MTHTKNIITGHYQQLRFSERLLIETWLSAKCSLRKIFRRLKRNVSTISREVKRGKTVQIGPNHTCRKFYFAETEQVIYERHRSAYQAISWIVKAPKFFNLLVKELKRKPRVHSVDLFTGLNAKPNTAVSFNTYSIPLH